MEKETTKAPAPPYVPYKTLVNFLERFKQGVPGRIDKNFMGSMSGGMRGQLTSSMKMLKLTNDAGVPQDVMKRLCAAEGPERQKILKALIIESYPYIFGDGFEFSTATHSLLREVIEENTTASGETVTRCISFLKEAAEDAGIPVSPFLSEHKPRGPRVKKNGGTRKTEKPSKAAGAEQSEHKEHGDHAKHTVIPAQTSMLLWGAFQRLPTPGAVWKKSEREQWLVMLTNILALEYPENQP